MVAVLVWEVLGKVMCYAQFNKNFLIDKQIKINST